MAVMIGRGIACRDAREQIQNECYPGGTGPDAASHFLEVAKVVATFEACRQAYAKKGCGAPPL
jgi:hypothetical protein